MPACRMTFSHLSRSALMKREKSSGLVATGIAERQQAGPRTRGLRTRILVDNLWNPAPLRLIRAGTSIACREGFDRATTRV